MAVDPMGLVSLARSRQSAFVDNLERVIDEALKKAVKNNAPPTQPGEVWAIDIHFDQSLVTADVMRELEQRYRRAGWPKVTARQEENEIEFVCLLPTRKAARRSAGSRVPAINGPGKIRPAGEHFNACVCGRRSASCSMAGAYCPTCRGRGAQNGWCGCGAALYPDGTCNQKKRHAKLEREACQT